ncbi:MAG: hypothetical protein LKM40_00430 [Mageeibacillus sp.]|nr:hypothetical protein [Mageeibacillus sp.]
MIADEMEEIDKKLDEDETIEGLREYRKLRKQFNELTEKLQGNKECI